MVPRPQVEGDKLGGGELSPGVQWHPSFSRLFRADAVSPRVGLPLKGPPGSVANWFAALLARVLFWFPQTVACWQACGCAGALSSAEGGMMAGAVDTLLESQQGVRYSCF